MSKRLDKGMNEEAVNAIENVLEAISGKELEYLDVEGFVYHLCEGTGFWVYIPQDHEEDYSKREGVCDSLEEKYGYKHVVQEGGGEGGAEDCYGVFKLGGKTYKAEYSYYSYHGGAYDNILKTLREVKPVEKTVIVYE